MTMSEWRNDKKQRFRGDVLTVLAGNHLSQLSRMDDVELCHALQSLAWDCELKDVVTIVQEMAGRNWVRYEWRRNRISQRVELYAIEILPEGQDLVDETTRHIAVSFR